MGCPKCSSPWGRIEGNKLLCKCGYEHTIPLKPSYADLEKQVEELKKERNTPRETPLNTR